MSRIRSLTVSLTLLGALALSGCGKKAFVPGVNSQLISAPGYKNLPPKVDILFSLDTVGNIASIFPDISPSFQTFASDLESSGWNYRLFTLPIKTIDTGTLSESPLSPNQVAGSIYDGNWAAQGLWESPYPGANITDPGVTLLSTVFAPLGAAFFPTSVVGESGREPGLQSQVTFLNRSDVQSIDRFRRPDALLAVITLSSGRDTSGATWTPWNNGNTGAGSQNSLWPQNPTPTATLASQLLATVGNDTSKIKYYSMVSYNDQVTPCRGFYTWSGTRYYDVSQALGGASYNICQQSLPEALNGIRNNLEIIRVAYRQAYLVLPNEPNPSTISVTKVSGGISQTLTKCEDATSSDCWHYAGYLSNQPTIDYPTLLNNATGYMVELRGTAKIEGDESGSVNFLNAGAEGPG